MIHILSLSLIILLPTKILKNLAGEKVFQETAFWHGGFLIYYAIHLLS